MSDAIDYDLMLYAQEHKRQGGCYVGETWVDFRGAPVCTDPDHSDFQRFAPLDRHGGFLAMVAKVTVYVRLKPAPLTADDRDILEAIRLRWHYPLNRWYQSYDRDDAELMYEAQEYRRTHGKDFTLAFGELFCGGALERFTGLDEIEALL